MISVERVRDVALLRMNDGKANAMSSPFFDALERGLDDCREAGAVVVTGAGNFFSAGLDLPAVFPLGRPEIEELYRLLHGAMLRIYSWDRPVVAAVNGHAIAGGCILALQTDCRVMAEGNFKIGLNETALGVGLPAFVIETCRIVLSPRVLASFVRDGTLYSPEQARQEGLVDATASPSDVVERSLEMAGAMAARGSRGFAESKRWIRRPAREAVERTFQEDLDSWVDVWFSPPTRRLLEEAVHKLTSRK